MVVDVDGSDLRAVSELGTFDYGGPSISADGSVVVYTQSDCIDSQGSCVSTWQIYRAMADGSGFTRLTSEPDVHHYWARISDDGQVILFQRYAPGEFGVHLAAMDADGTNQRQLTSVLPIAFYFPYCRRGCEGSGLSGDGLTGVFATEQGGVFVVGTDGSGLRQIGYGGPVDPNGRVTEVSPQVAKAPLRKTCVPSGTR